MAGSRGISSAFTNIISMSSSITSVTLRPGRTGRGSTGEESGAGRCSGSARAGWSTSRSRYGYRHVRQFCGRGGVHGVVSHKTALAVWGPMHVNLARGAHYGVMRSPHPAPSAKMASVHWVDLAQGERARRMARRLYLSIPRRGAGHGERRKFISRRPSVDRARARGFASPTAALFLGVAQVRVLPHVPAPYAMAEAGARDHQVHESLRAGFERSQASREAQVRAPCTGSRRADEHPAERTRHPAHARPLRLDVDFRRGVAVQVHELGAHLRPVASHYRKASLRRVVAELVAAEGGR